MKSCGGDGSDSRSVDDSSGDSERGELCARLHTSSITLAGRGQQRPSESSAKSKVHTPQKLILPKETLNQTSSATATASSQGKPAMAAAAAAAVTVGAGSGGAGAGSAQMVTSAANTGHGPQQILVFSPTPHPTPQGQQPVLILSPIHRRAAPLQHPTSPQVLPVQSVIMNAIAGQSHTQGPAPVAAKSVNVVQVPILQTSVSSHSATVMPKGFTIAPQLANQLQQRTVTISADAESHGTGSKSATAMLSTGGPSSGAIATSINGRLNSGVVASSAFLPVGAVPHGGQKQADPACQATVTWSHPLLNSASVQANPMLPVLDTARSIPTPEPDMSRNASLSKTSEFGEGVVPTPTGASGPAVPLTPTTSSLSTLILNSPTSIKLLSRGSTSSSSGSPCNINSTASCGNTDLWSTAANGSKLASKTVSSLLKEQRGYGPSVDNKAPYVNDRRPVSALLKDIRAKRQHSAPSIGLNQTGCTQSPITVPSSAESTLSPNTVMIQTLTISKPSSNVGSTATVPSEQSPRMTAPVPVVSTSFMLNSSSDQGTQLISDNSSTISQFNSARHLIIKAEAEDLQSPVRNGASLGELLQQPIEEVTSTKKRTLTTSEVLPRKRQNTGSNNHNRAQKRNLIKLPTSISCQNSQLTQALMALSPPQPKIDAELLRQEIQRQLKAGLSREQTGFASRLAISLTQSDTSQQQQQQRTLAGAPTAQLVVANVPESREVNVSSLEKDALNDYFFNDPAPDLADITPSIAQMVHSQEVQTLTDQDAKGGLSQTQGTTGQSQVQQLVKSELVKSNTTLNAHLKAFLAATTTQCDGPAAIPLSAISGLQLQQQLQQQQQQQQELQQQLQQQQQQQQQLGNQHCEAGGTLDMFSDPLPQSITSIDQALLHSAETTPCSSPGPAEQTHPYIRLKGDVLLSQAVDNKRADILVWQQQQQHQRQQQQYQQQRQRHRSFPDHMLRLNTTGRNSVNQQGLVLSGVDTGGNTQGALVMTPVSGNLIQLQSGTVTTQPQLMRSASAQGMVMVSSTQPQTASTVNQPAASIAQHNLIFRLASQANLHNPGLNMSLSLATNGGQVQTGGTLSHPQSPAQLLSPNSVSTHHSAASTPVSVLSPQTPMSHGTSHSRSVGPSPVEVNPHAFMPIQNLQLEGTMGVSLVRPTATVASTAPQTTISATNQQQLEVAEGSRFMPYCTQPVQNTNVSISAVNQQPLQPSTTNQMLRQKLAQKVSLNTNKTTQEATPASSGGRRKEVAHFAPASSIKPVKRGGRGANKGGTGRRQRHHSAQSALGGATSTQSRSAGSKYSLMRGNNNNIQTSLDLQQTVNIMADVNMGLGSSTPESPFSPEIQDIFCSGLQGAGTTNMFRSQSVPATDLLFDSDPSNSNDMFPHTSVMLDGRQDSEFMEDLSGTDISSLASLLQGKLHEENVPSTRGTHTSTEGFGARRNLTELIEQRTQLNNNLPHGALQKHSQGNAYFRGSNFDFDDQSSSDHVVGFRGRGDVTLTSASLQDTIPRSVQRSLSCTNDTTPTPPSSQNVGLDFSSEIQNIVGQNTNNALTMHRLGPTSTLGSVSNLDTPSSMDTLSTQDSRESLTDSLFQNTYDGSGDLAGNHSIDMSSDFGFPQWDMTQMVHD